MTLAYHQEIETVFEAQIGTGGIEKGRVDNLLKAAAPVLDDLRAAFKADRLPFARHAVREDDLAEIGRDAQRLADSGTELVVLGTGGSSLGAQVLTRLAQDRFFKGATGAPRLHFPDNLDPVSFMRLLAVLDLEETHFLVVSKSGGTAETVAQTLAAMDALRRAGLEARMADHVTVLTQPGDSVLRRLAARWNLPVIDHDPDLGGRYSVFSNVGLIPAAAAGIDIAAVRAGASAVWQLIVAGAEPGAVPPVMGAAVAVAGSEEGLKTSVLMPYADILEPVVMWYRQLWAESLGKQGEGTTPIGALGPVDQHSQLQLYLDGPKDKLFTILAPALDGLGPAIDTGLAGDDPDLAYLTGHTIGDLVAAECHATAETLIQGERPVRRLTVDRFDGEAAGALMMHFMVETVTAAGLLQVDPYDQPAVEQGKILTKDYLMKA